MAFRSDAQRKAAFARMQKLVSAKARKAAPLSRRGFSRDGEYGLVRPEHLDHALRLEKPLTRYIVEGRELSLDPDKRRDSLGAATAELMLDYRNAVAYELHSRAAEDLQADLQGELTRKLFEQELMRRGASRSEIERYREQIRDQVVETFLQEAEGQEDASS